MANLTDDLDLGPGVVVTPGHEVPEPRPKSIMSDRKLDSDGNVVNPGDAEFGSTYEKGGAAGVAQPASSATPSGESLSLAAPDRKVSTPEDAS